MLAQVDFFFLFLANIYQCFYLPTCKKLFQRNIYHQKYIIKYPAKLRQPTGQRLCKVRTQQKSFLMVPILFLYYEKVWYYQTWIQNYLGFIVSNLIYILHMHVAQWLLNQFKQVQQSRQQMLRACCSNIYFDHKL